MIRGARRRVRGDFSQRKMSESHQRRKWARPTYGHDPAVDRLAACPSGPPPYLRGNAALSMVVFGLGKKMGAAFSILYLHGVRQEGSIVWVLPSCVSPRYAGGVPYF